MINIVYGSTQKPVASRQLADFFSSSNGNGTFYIGYPIMGSPEGAFSLDALLISSDIGLVIFHIVEGKELGNIEEVQDNIYTKLQAKLLQHRALLKSRRLQVAMNVVTFAPAIKNLDSNNIEYPICNDNNSLTDFLSAIEKWPENNLYQNVVAIIQAISTLRKGKKREIKKPDSRGNKLKDLENSIANLDSNQNQAVIETFDGVQRIRGLAGSGKTIVLALKVAYLHANNPDWNIAVTFHTRSLKGQFERLINNFIIEQTSEEPNWDKIQIIHAWGSPGQGAGIYYNFCLNHGIEFLDFKTAKARFGTDKEFDGACGLAVSQINEYKPLYDIILIDEAQDFSPSFLQICYQLVKKDSKNSARRLVYAYDELQSLNKKSLPSPEEIFGNKPNGEPVVKFMPPQAGKPKQDIVLGTCYRNSRPLLTTAHALGFGIYRDKLIQMFDHSQLWLDIGYKVEEGRLSDKGGENICLTRDSETSPDFLQNHSKISDLIRFKSFVSDEEQINWLVESIVNNIREEELLPNDIIVINTNPVTTRNAVAQARKKLFEQGINSNLAGISTSPDIFVTENCVTFTGIYRAKGNEAAMVYIINAQDCYTAWRGELVKVRNRLFTAITRSKAWVRVYGIGNNMLQLTEEFKKVYYNDFKLTFLYPTVEERQQLNIVNRDMTVEEKRRIDQKKVNLEEILRSLESGETVIEDYPEETFLRLQAFLDIVKKGRKI